MAEIIESFDSILAEHLGEGEVPEWLIGAVSKTVDLRKEVRGFESHPLRQKAQGRESPEPSGGEVR